MKDKAIYILPGWSYNTDKWSDLVSFFKKEEIEVHKLNIPGLEEKIDTPWDISDYVNWLDEKLKNETKKIVLVGHSNGGRIALSYIIKHPEKISNLILIDSAGIMDKSFKNKIKKNIFRLLARVGKSIRLPLFTRPLLYKLAREKDYLNANPLAAKTMQNLISLDLKDNLKKIKTPTSIIWGESDKVTPHSFAKIFYEGIENSKLFIIKNARHSPQYTHPEKIFEIIKNAIS